jgi:hypothetical protein
MNIPLEQKVFKTTTYLPVVVTAPPITKLKYQSNSEWHLYVVIDCISLTIALFELPANHLKNWCHRSKTVERLFPSSQGIWNINPPHCTFKHP